MQSRLGVEKGETESFWFWSGSSNHRLICWRGRISCSSLAAFTFLLHARSNCITPWLCLWLRLYLHSGWLLLPIPAYPNHIHPSRPAQTPLPYRLSHPPNSRAFLPVPLTFTLRISYRSYLRRDPSSINLRATWGQAGSESVSVFVSLVPPRTSRASVNTGWASTIVGAQSVLPPNAQRASPVATASRAPKQAEERRGARRVAGQDRGAR